MELTYFQGLPGEDFDQFLTIFEIENYERWNSYDTTKQDIAKCVFLRKQLKPQSIAANFVNALNSVTLNDWEKLVNRIKERFPTEDNEIRKDRFKDERDSLQQQQGEDLINYLQRARVINDELGADYEQSRMVRKTLAGLLDKNLGKALQAQVNFREVDGNKVHFEQCAKLVRVGADY